MTNDQLKQNPVFRLGAFSNRCRLSSCCALWFQIGNIGAGQHNLTTPGNFLGAPLKALLFIRSFVMFQPTCRNASKAKIMNGKEDERKVSMELLHTCVAWSLPNLLIESLAKSKPYGWQRPTLNIWLTSWIQVCVKSTNCIYEYILKWLHFQRKMVSTPVSLRKPTTSILEEPFVPFA